MDTTTITRFEGVRLSPAGSVTRRVRAAKRP